MRGLVCLMVLAFIAATIAAEELKYNYHEDKYEFAHNDEVLRYNYHEDKYEFAKPTDQLRYNYQEDTYKYVDPKAELRYNYYEDEYEFAKPNQELRWNYFEDKHEFAYPNAELRWNYFENEYEFVYPRQVEPNVDVPLLYSNPFEEDEYYSPSQGILEGYKAYSEQQRYRQSRLKEQRDMMELMILLAQLKYAGDRRQSQSFADNQEPATTIRSPKKQKLKGIKFSLRNRSSLKNAQAQIEFLDGRPDFEWLDPDAFQARWKTSGKIENTGTAMATHVKIVITVYDTTNVEVEEKAGLCFPPNVRPGDTASFYIFGYYDKKLKWTWDVIWEE